jgi:hypothetical protein
MQLFGLTLVGDPEPVAAPAVFSHGVRPPRIHTELLQRWGRGKIAGEVVLTTPEELEQTGRVFEREAEIDSELSVRSPIDSMPLDEWRGLASFASRDRLELAWVRGREADGPLWAINVSMGHFARVPSFESAAFPSRTRQVSRSISSSRTSSLKTTRESEPNVGFATP